MDWDIFISHAWEDKEAFARPLTKALERKGLRVWQEVRLRLRRPATWIRSIPTEGVIRNLCGYYSNPLDC